MYTIVYFIDSTAFGGMERCVLNLLEGLDRQLWRPVLMFHPDPGLKRLLEEASQIGVPLRPVPRVSVLQAMTTMPAIFRTLLTEKPIVFHAHQSYQIACGYGLLAASIVRTPIVVTTSHLFRDELHNSVNLAKSQVITASVDRYIAVSDWIAGKLSKALKIKRRKVSVVRNGITIDRYTIPPDTILRSELTGGSDRPIVLMPARLEQQKGHRYLLEAAAQLPEPLFLLAGEGPDREALEAQARSLGLIERVRFLGHRKDIPALLSICDVFVLPSLCEGLPLSILEAMAAGKPVIASAIGGTEEVIIHNETGLLVPPRDASALADAIHRVLSDPIWGGELATTGQRRVRKMFPVQKMVEGTVAVYEELLGTVKVARAKSYEVFLGKN